MTGAERVLAELRSGPKTAAELYARTYCVVHSRISELRSHGYRIELERVGGTGAGSYLYRLVSATDGMTSPEAPRPDPSRRGAYPPELLTEAGVAGPGPQPPCVAPGQLTLEDVLNEQTGAGIASQSTGKGDVHRPLCWSGLLVEDAA